MDFSEEKHESDGEVIDDILGPEDLFNDEADDIGDRQSDEDETKESSGKTEDDSKIDVKKKVKQKRIVRNPRVVLNFDSLKGNNGLGALKKLFKNFKFKGSGHEKEDLTRIMEVLQQWMGYQLCPSYNFESCILQLEVLGKKKVVQTLMKKYRLGMDDWGENKSDNENDAIVEEQMEVFENSNTNGFDSLFDENVANAMTDDDLSQCDAVQSQTNETTIQSSQEVTLTQEQLERIARNKKAAEERRMKRMSVPCTPTNLSQQQEQTEQEMSLAHINLEKNT